MSWGCVQRDYHVLKLLLINNMVVYAATAFFWNNLSLQNRNANTVNAFKTMLKSHIFKSYSE